VTGVNKFPRFCARRPHIISSPMDSTSLFFLLHHIRDLKYLSAAQWLSILGSGITAFGVSLAADPHHFEVATGAAIGTIAVAIVHVLQPSPINAQNSKEAK
jgi:hypothetical protein